MTSEKLTIGYEVHNRTEKLKTSKEVVKVTDEIHKRTGNITTNYDIDKGTEKLEYMKEAVATIRRKDLDQFECQYKGYTGWFNSDSDF